MAGQVKLTLLITSVLKGKDSYKDAQKGLEGVGKSANIASTALKALSAVAVGAFLMDSIKKAGEFSDGMMAVKAATQATDEQFKQLEDEAKRIGEQFGRFTATEAAEGMRNLAYAGFSVDETLTAIEPVMKLSQAGMIDLGSAATAVAGSMRSFGLDAGDTGRIVDVMTKTFISSNTTMQELSDAIKYVGPVASEAGMSFEELNATIGVLADANIRGSEAGTALRNILVRIQAPSSEAKRTLSDLGVSLYELPPAAQAAQRALDRDYQELTKLEQQMDETAMASKALQADLNKLNIQESKNNLEIMKIRDKAADENRKLNKDELSAIDKLEAANRDLSISQAELSIQQDELKTTEEELNTSIETTKTSITTNSEAFESAKGSLRSMADITTEFNKATMDLSDAQKTEALATVFGMRSISAMQILMKSMSEDTADGAKTIDGFTNTLLNSSGTADEVSATMEEGLGNQIAQLQSTFEAFQLELVEAIMPTLLDLMNIAKEDLIPALYSLIPALTKIASVVGTVVSIIAPLIVQLTEVPGLVEAVVIGLIAWKISQIALNIAMMANPIGLIIIAIVALIVAIWLLVDNWDQVKEGLLAIWDGLKEGFISAVDAIKLAFSTLADAIMAPFVAIYDVIMDIIDAVKSVVDAVDDATDSVGGFVGDIGTGGNIEKIGGFLGFAEGGTVPGPLGSPTLAVVHGGEEIYPPGDSPGKSVTLNSNDNITINFSSNQALTQNELQNIGTQLADMITIEKRRSDQNSLLESG